MRTITGYHGTPLSNLTSIAATGLRAGHRNGLWLGSGVYYFMDAPLRSKSYATRWMRGPPEPVTLLRSEISLEHCLDLVDLPYWNFLSSLYKEYADQIENRIQAERLLKGRSDQVGPADYLELLRSGQIDPMTGYNVRDCILMNLACQELERQGTRVDVVRCAFVEGQPVYTNSWLWDESNVMICVKNPAAILNTVRVDEAGIAHPLV